MSERKNERERAGRVKKEGDTLIEEERKRER